MQSKIQLTDTLRADGFWDEASAFRDQQRMALKAVGIPRQTAAHEAWLRLEETYQLKAGDSESPFELHQDVCHVSEIGEASKSEFPDVLRWSFVNIRERLTAEPPPSELAEEFFAAMKEAPRLLVYVWGVQFFGFPFCAHNPRSVYQKPKQNVG